MLLFLDFLEFLSFEYLELRRRFIIFQIWNGLNIFEYYSLGEDWKFLGWTRHNGANKFSLQDWRCLTCKWIRTAYEQRVSFYAFIEPISAVVFQFQCNPVGRWRVYR